MNARAAALAGLERVLFARASLDEVSFPATLSPRDRQFALALMRAVLRHRGWFGLVLGRYLRTPLPVTARRAELALHLGAAQILVLETPPHAAVGETVDLVKDRASQRYANLLNAVLRRVVADAPILREEMRAAQGAIDALPVWLAERWRATYGERLGALAQACLQPAPLDLTVRDDARAWAERLGGTVVDGSVRLTEHDAVETLPGFAEGAWWVQDVAATLPVRLMGDLKDKTVFDLCAAPGGKTAQLCAAGAHVTALDRSAPRLKRLRENMTRLGFAPEVVVADVLSWQPPAPADAVLLDAPCTATGTLRRHPELMWHKGPEDIDQLAALQARMLPKAFSMLKPGGVLVYATCSLEPEEGERQLEAFLAATPEAEPLPMRPDETTDPVQVTPQGFLRVLPCDREDGMDGFFVARLRKRGT